MMATRKYSEEFIAEIRHLVQLDFTRKEIAEAINIKMMALYGIMKRYSITLSSLATEKEHLLRREQNIINGRKSKKHTYNKGNTICVYCKNTNLNDCTLFNPDIAKPPKGAVFKTNRSGFLVKECERFKQDKS